MGHWNLTRKLRTEKNIRNCIKNTVKHFRPNSTKLKHKCDNILTLNFVFSQSQTISLLEPILVEPAICIKFCNHRPLYRMLLQKRNVALFNSSYQYTICFYRLIKIYVKMYATNIKAIIIGYIAMNLYKIY